MIKKYYEEFKPAIHFLARLLLTYAIFSISYSFWVKSYGTHPDPITRAVTYQVKAVSGGFYDSVTTSPTPNKPSVDVFINGKYTISVFEGCNGAAIIYLYLAFLVGFWGGLKRLAIFSIIGVIIIHFFNLVRLLLLSHMALTIGNTGFYHFTHKYIFTLSIYIVVFALWIVWIRQVKPKKKPETQTHTDGVA